MKLLLDTHVFLWWERRSAALHQRAIDAIAAPEHVVIVSAVTVWEIAIKRRAGKLVFDGSVTAAIEAAGFHPEPIQPIDGEHAGDLAWPHPDPFDRLLVVQAMRLGCVLVTADRMIRALDAVPHLWAR